jgi:hypothetical protein
VGSGGGQGREDLDGEFGGGNGIAIPIPHGGNGSKPRVERLGYGATIPSRRRWQLSNGNTRIECHLRRKARWPTEGWHGTVRLTSIVYPQIEGKLTATPGGLTNLVYGCKD